MSLNDARPWEPWKSPRSPTEKEPERKANMKA
jgi:hypothetical protein